MVNHIKVAGITYKVVEKDLSTRHEESYGVEMGYCIVTDDTIEINESLTQERKEQTLIHEMTHAMFFEAGLSRDDEEDTVNRLSLVLYQVLKDNDFSWLRK